MIVPDYQLSLAIGKEGQNARLAARLTGWRVDIKSETQVGDEQKAKAQAAAQPVAAAQSEAPPEPMAEAPAAQPAAVEQGGS